MAAEFDTLAEWTAQVAADLGPTYHVPAGCRGSGSPAALDWLTDHLDLASGETLLDCGAGVGGPAAFAAQRKLVRPVLVDPEAGACRAARSLFGYPVLRASASALPVADESFNAAWSLGVLCTTSSQLALLTELRRVVRPPGRIGLLVLVAGTSMPDEQPEGNYFPTAESLVSLVDKAGLRIEACRGTGDMTPAPQKWQDLVETVTSELRARHGHQREWQLGERQSDQIKQLLENSSVTSELLALRHR